MENTDFTSEENKTQRSSLIFFSIHPASHGPPEHLRRNESWALPVLENSSEQLKMEGAPLVPRVSPDNSLLTRELLTHFTEAETEVGKGKEAAQGKRFTSTCSSELLLI